LSDDSLALSDQAKRELVLRILETFVPHAESFHRASDLTAPRTDFYVAHGPGVTQPRGAGNVAFAYATLLTELPDQAGFGGVARAVMLDHTVQSIRHEALTSKLAGVGDGWGGGTWQASLETYGWGWAAHLLWQHLDEQTRDAVERVVVGEADILITKPIATATEGNTGAEDNAWNAPTPVLANVMFPDHPNRPQWAEAAIKLAVNASSTAADEQSGELLDGRPLRDWIASVNLQPDLTMENHGFFNPIYQQVAPLLIGDAAALYSSAGRAVPEGFSWRVEEIWTRVLAQLAADDGDLVMPAGQDWTSKDYQHLAYLTVLATRFRRADASVAESRALQLVARRQGTHANGSILGQPQLGYETMLIKRLTGAYWNHKLFGPSPQPTQEEYDAALADSAGVHRLEFARLVEARQRDAFTSMSWDTARPMGLVVPGATGHQDDPVLTAYPPGSLVGETSGPVGAFATGGGEDRFSTAGTIGDRRFSMTSFPDGVTLLLDRGQGATFRFAFELIPGLTAPRPVHSAGGTGLGELEGNWANVADRFGVAVAGGDGPRAVEIGGENPHLRLDGSRHPVNHAHRAPATASSNQAPFPPGLATDGDPATFWVSQNPATVSAPQWLEVDLGQDREISLLIMTPRPNFGPRNLAWQVPDGSGGWREVARAVATRSGPARVVVEPVTTNRIRLVLTSGHDPRNVQVVQVHAGQAGSGNRGAAVYPLLDATETERLAATLRQPPIPDGWSALFAVAPDRTGRLAVSRWAGAGSVSLTLGTERGAPVTSGGVTVDGDDGVADVALGSPGSVGELTRFFLRAEPPLHALASAEHHASLRNKGAETATAKLTYVDVHGHEHTTRVELRGGQRAEAAGTPEGVGITVF
jgi:hypothetical protein